MPLFKNLTMVNVDWNIIECKMLNGHWIIPYVTSVLNFKLFRY